jgi:hypothetical protein
MIPAGKTANPTSRANLSLCLLAASSTSISPESIRKARRRSTSVFSGLRDLDLARTAASCPASFTCVRPDPLRIHRTDPNTVRLDGGGWVLGSKGSEMHQCTNYCSRARCIVVTVDCQYLSFLTEMYSLLTSARMYRSSRPRGSVPCLCRGLLGSTAMGR